MEKRQPIRNVFTRRRQPRQRRSLPQRRQDEEGRIFEFLEEVPGFFKGKGKGKNAITTPVFTITFEPPTTATITSVSTFTLEPSSTPVITTTLAAVPPPVLTLVPLPTPITTLVPGTTLPPTSSSSSTGGFITLSPSSSSTLSTLSSDTTSSTDTAIAEETPASSTVDSSTSLTESTFSTEAPLPTPTTLSTVRVAEPSEYTGTAVYGDANPEPTGPPPVEASPQRARLNSTQTAGIAVGSIFGLILLLALLVFGVRKWRQRRLPGFEMMPGSRTQDPFLDAGVGQSDLTFRDFPPPLPPKNPIRKPKPIVAKWINQMRQIIPVRTPEPPTFGVVSGESEKGSQNPAPSVRKKPTRSIISTIFKPHAHHTPSPPPGSSGSQSAPSTSGGRSRLHRQSGVSDTSFWTTAPTQRTDSGIFVPPTALSYPRVVVTSPLADSPGRPPPMPVEDARRTVRFSAPNVASATPSIRASVISSESRSGS